MPTLKACDICKVRMVDEGCVIVFVEIGVEWEEKPGHWLACTDCSWKVSRFICKEQAHHEQIAQNA
jgi:hypothetical protein